MGLHLSNSGWNERAESLSFLVLPFGCTGTDLSFQAAGREARLSSVGVLPPHCRDHSVLCSRPLFPSGTLSQPSCSPGFLTFKSYSALMPLVVQVPQQLISYSPGLQTASGFLLYSQANAHPSSLVKGIVLPGSRGGRQRTYYFNGLCLCVRN